MAKVHRRGIWYQDVRMDALCFSPPGFYDEAEYPQPVVIIPGDSIPALLTVLDELGYIKPRLDERLRVEDLKITHRLLDLLDKALDPPTEHVIVEG